MVRTGANALGSCRHAGPKNRNGSICRLIRGLKTFSGFGIWSKDISRARGT
jgi:hypothetical protein